MTPVKKLRVVVVEPYYTGSHRSWADGLEAHSRHDVHLLTHEGGFWKWRMHGAAVTLAQELEAFAADHGHPDVLMVSDMVNLAALTGLARRSLGDAAIALYMHENQLTYPLPGDGVRDEGYAMANWVSMCAADTVVFNSHHHRREFWAALPRFLRRFPDHRHTSIVDDVRDRSTVLPLGIDSSLCDLPRADDEGAPIVLWNHRWEYDKDPVAFFASLDELERRGVAFRLAVAGMSYQTVPAEFDAARDRFGDRIVHFGTAPHEAYVDLLRRSSVVVSTARHDFFGLAVVEAVAAGALPVLPARLSYPELLPDALAARWLYADATAPTDVLERALTDHEARRADAVIAREHMRRYTWPAVIGDYDDLFDALAGEAVARATRQPLRSARRS